MNLNYTRQIVSTVGGQVRVMTGEMRDLMKRGIARNLVPLSDFKGPRLKLDKESKAEISSLKKDIQHIKREMSRLEYTKSKVGLDDSEISDLNRQIELCQFDIFENQTKIRDIKVKCFSKQKSTIDLDA